MLYVSWPVPVLYIFTENSNESFVHACSAVNGHELAAACFLKSSVEVVIVILGKGVPQHNVLKLAHTHTNTNQAFGQGLYNYTNIHPIACCLAQIIVDQPP